MSKHTSTVERPAKPDAAHILVGLEAREQYVLDLRVLSIGPLLRSVSWAP